MDYKKKRNTTKKMAKQFIPYVTSFVLAGMISVGVNMTEAEAASSWDFNYTGGNQTWTVPATGAYQIEAWGAEGGRVDTDANTGGDGGYVKGVVNLTAGQVIVVRVGGQGQNSATNVDGSSSSLYAGGWPNGGRGSGTRGPGGGGSTDFSWNGSRQIVAGGGGGGFDPGSFSGGNSVSLQSTEYGQNGFTGYSGNYPTDNAGGGGGWLGGNTVSGDDPSRAYGGSNYISSSLSSTLNQLGVRQGSGFARITSLNAPPTFTVNGMPATNTLVRPGGTFAVSGTATDPDNRGTVYIKYRFGSGSAVTLTTLTGSSTAQSYSGTVTIPTLADGTHAFSIWAEDSEGSVQTAKSVNVVVDSTAPSRPTLTSSTTATTNQNVTVSATFPSDAAQKLYTIGSYKNSYENSVGGIYVKGTGLNRNSERILEVNGNQIYSVGYGRGIRLTVLNRTDLSVVFDQNYDVYGDVAEQVNLANKLNSLNYDVIVVLSSFDALYVDQDILKNALIRVGGSGDTLSYRTPFSLIGIPTIGKGNGIEKYTNTEATADYAEISTKVTNGVPNGLWLPYTSAISVTENGIVSARAIDQAGNISAVGSLTVSNIDKTAPALATFTQSPVVMTKGNVSVTIAYPSDAVTKQYRMNGGAWETYSAAVTVTANAKIEAISYDAAGNVSPIASTMVSNIDRIAPVLSITGNPTEWTNQNATISVNATDVQKYENTLVRTNVRDWVGYNALDNSIDYRNASFQIKGKLNGVIAPNPATTTSIGFSYIATGGNRVWITAKTWSFSEIMSGQTSFDVDFVVPDNYASGLSPWIQIDVPHGDTSHTVEYSDLCFQLKNSGVQSIVKPDGTAVTGSQASFVVSQNGTYNLVVKDALGNERIVPVTVNKIDKTAPTPPSISFSNGYVTGAWSNRDVTVTITSGVDSHSGTGVTEYRTRLDGGAWSEWQTYVSPFILNREGVTEVAYRTIDLAGNTNTISSEVKIDKSAPANATFVKSTEEATNQPVAVTINFPSDVVSKMYKIGSTGEWTAYTAPVSVSSNNTVYAKSEDSAGNWSAESSISVMNIDKMPPAVATLSADKTAPTNGSVTLTAVFPSDAVVKQYKVNGGSWMNYTSSIEMKTNGTVYVRSQDAAGNLSPESSLVVNNIDQVAPIVTLTSANTSTSNRDAVISILVEEIGSGVKLKKFSVGTKDEEYFEQNGESVSGDEFTVATNGVYTVYVEDKAGNKTIKIIEIDSIDKTAPSISFTPSTTLPTNASVTIQVQVDDEESGVAEVKYATGSRDTNYFVTGGEELVDHLFEVESNQVITIFAKDHAGNLIVREITISNIDKEAPFAPVVTANTDEQTNQSVTISVTKDPSEMEQVSFEYRFKNEGGSTWTRVEGAISVSNNSVIEVRAKDEAENFSEVTSFTIENIDKVSPTTPSVTTNGNVVTVVPGTDSGFGVQTTYIKINNGEWEVYVDPRTLPDGVYSLKVKTVDKVGNVSEVVQLDVRFYAESLEVARDAVDAVNKSKNQAELDSARELVNGFPSSPEKDDLIAQLDQIQAFIDYERIQSRLTILSSKLNKGGLTEVELDSIQEELNSLTNELSVLPNTVDKSAVIAELAGASQKTEVIEKVLELTESSDIEEIENLEEVINSLPDGELKDSLIDQVQAVEIKKEALESVAILEQNQDRDALNSAKEAANKLPNSPEKEEILVRINSVEKIVVGIELTESVESSLSQDAFNDAQEAINQITDEVKKQELQDRLDAIKPVVSTVSLVKNAEISKSQDDVNQARQQINLITDEALKKTLHERLNLVDGALKEAQYRISQAEKYKTNIYVTSANQAINLLVESPQKDDLVTRFEALKAQIATDTLVKNMELIEQKVTMAERYKTNTYLAEAWSMVNGLPTGVEKDAFVARLNKVQVEIGGDDTGSTNLEVSIQINSITDPMVKSMFLDVMRAVERAEKYAVRTYIVWAIDKIAAIPADVRSNELYVGIVTNMTNRVNAVKDGYNTELQEQIDSKALSNANNYVELYEKYRSTYYKNKAQDYVNALPNSDAKTLLQSRIDSVVMK